MGACVRVGNQRANGANGHHRYGYPALVAFSPAHNKYAPLKLTFDKKHVKDFIAGVQKVQCVIEWWWLSCHPINKLRKVLYGPLKVLVTHNLTDFHLLHVPGVHVHVAMPLPRALRGSSPSRAP